MRPALLVAALVALVLAGCVDVGTSVMSTSTSTSTMSTSTGWTHDFREGEDRTERLPGDAMNRTLRIGVAFAPATNVVSTNLGGVCEPSDDPPPRVEVVDPTGRVAFTASPTGEGPGFGAAPCGTSEATLSLPPGAWRVEMHGQGPFRAQIGIDLDGSIRTSG